jgi:hypothetical protein
VIVTPRACIIHPSLYKVVREFLMGDRMKFSFQKLELQALEMAPAMALKVALAKLPLEDTSHMLCFLL